MQALQPLPLGGPEYAALDPDLHDRSGEHLVPCRKVEAHLPIRGPWIQDIPQAVAKEVKR